MQVIFDQLVWPYGLTRTREVLSLLAQSLSALLSPLGILWIASMTCVEFKLVLWHVGSSLVSSMDSRNLQLSTVVFGYFIMR